VTIAVRVPASTSNLGAGFDCLGLALDLWLEAKLVDGHGAPKYTGTVAGMDPKNDRVYHILADRSAITNVRLELRSDIPIGKGLGSSAAAAVAGLALACLAKGESLDRAEIFREAAIIEGHPDNAGPAVYGGLVLAAHRPTQLTLHPDLGVALAVPKQNISTNEARKLVPTAVPRETAVAQASRSAALVLGLASGERELIAFGMGDRLAVPHRKQLIEGYDSAEAAGLEAGAYGVTISGAGSALLAIAPRHDVEAVAEAMVKALSEAGNTALALTPSVAETGVTEVTDGT